MSMLPGRQTHMMLEGLSARVERRVRIALHRLLWIAFAFIGIFAMLTPLIWTGLTQPRLYAITPAGEVVPLQAKGSQEAQP